eukprot:4153916-Prymnesium_polylepis.1
MSVVASSDGSVGGCGGAVGGVLGVVGRVDVGGCCCWVARSHRRGQRRFAYGVRVRAEGCAYRK